MPLNPFNQLTIILCGTGNLGDFRNSNGVLLMNIESSVQEIRMQFSWVIKNCKHLILITSEIRKKWILMALKCMSS